MLSRLLLCTGYRGWQLQIRNMPTNLRSLTDKDRGDFEMPRNFL